MRALPIVALGVVLVACGDDGGSLLAGSERAERPSGDESSSGAVDAPAEGGGSSSSSSSSTGGSSSSSSASSSSTSSGGSSSGGTSSGGSSSGGTSDPYAATRDACVAAVNKFRATKGLSALKRYPAKEACADQQAAKDATMSSAHYAYLNGAPSCIEDNVLDRQNECPGWYQPTDKAATDCVAKMVAEGPGTGAAHGHYNVLVNPQYTRLSCGVYIKPGAPASSATWLVFNFY